MITNIYDVKACPECAGINLSYLYDRDQVVCRDCGLVYEPLTPQDERKLERVSQSLKKSKVSNHKETKKLNQSSIHPPKKHVKVALPKSKKKIKRIKR